MLFGTSIFIVGLFCNSVYYGRKIWKNREKTAIVCAWLIGASIMLLEHNGYSCLFGIAIIESSVFFMLLRKYKTVSK
jgi:hypothetical protein